MPKQHSQVLFLVWLGRKFFLLQDKNLNYKGDWLHTNDDYFIHVIHALTNARTLYRNTTITINNSHEMILLASLAS